MAINNVTQVWLAFEHIDGELRNYLTKPSATSTIAGMIEELRLQKEIWFDIYAIVTSSKSSLGNSSGQKRP